MELFSQQLSVLKTAIDRLDLNQLQQRLDQAIELCVAAVTRNKPMLVCGNGGSAADAQHIAGELVGRFLQDRRALNVRALTTDTSVITAWANDVGYDTVFSRQVEAYGQAGGVLLAISTSGNSGNVVRACVAAKQLDMKVISLTGEGGGKLAEMSQVLLDVPSKLTPRIQEMHIMLYHYLCERIEARIR